MGFGDGRTGDARQQGEQDVGVHFGQLHQLDTAQIAAHGATDGQLIKGFVRAVWQGACKRAVKAGVTCVFGRDGNIVGFLGHVCPFQDKAGNPPALPLGQGRAWLCCQAKRLQNGGLTVHTINLFDAVDQVDFNDHITIDGVFEVGQRHFAFHLGHVPGL